MARRNKGTYQSESRTISKMDGRLIEKGKDDIVIRIFYLTQKMLTPTPLCEKSLN